MSASLRRLTVDVGLSRGAGMEQGGQQLEVGSMGVETEVKIRLESGELERIRASLPEAGGVQISPRALEENWLFDRGTSLQKQGCALRLRVYDGSASVTYKGPVKPDRKFKKRLEFEVSVSDGGAMRGILESLGFRICFRYDKFREKWVLGKGGVQTEICLDETPIGDFAEIEGEPDSVLETAAVLGLESGRFVLANYVDLYQEAGLGEP